MNTMFNHVQTQFAVCFPMQQSFFLSQASTCRMGTTSSATVKAPHWPEYIARPAEKLFSLGRSSLGPKHRTASLCPQPRSF